MKLAALFVLAAAGAALADKAGYYCAGLTGAQFDGICALLHQQKIVGFFFISPAYGRDPTNTRRTPGARRLLLKISPRALQGALGLSHPVSVPRIFTLIPAIGPKLFVTSRNRECQVTRFDTTKHSLRIQKLRAIQRSLERNSSKPSNNSSNTYDKMVRLAQTVALLLAAIPTALAVDICQCNNDRYTYGACQLAIKATANPPKARRGLDRVPPGDDPIHPPHKDPPTTRNYPFWTYYWDRDDKKGYASIAPTIR
ncbi:uncharacterized protein MYCGRDRAFT_93448 [Zymoseptoria tritici IPO323]|uniref:Uncharacterized protein n=1 Tax=Zymoseptoria tritici (strain CBS 115943 / IPO323) TaxID=336722 RepID=F9XC22_ZYMTI|nr:uncharacterized protein MYCGRDRAFT_93448 [Zymoseptoria tritici IPO323]EGP87296.1 hypothetical protein MYCGRDRAFT_93448 [Zymoseptoria tritici IPO323]